PAARRTPAAGDGRTRPRTARSPKPNRRKRLAHQRALLGEPVVEREHVVADAEMPDSQLEIALGLSRVSRLGADGDVQPLGSLDHVSLGLAHPVVRPLAGEAQTERVVARAELNHVDAADAENRLEVLDGLSLLD